MERHWKGGGSIEKGKVWKKTLKVKYIKEEEHKVESTLRGKNIGRKRYWKRRLRRNILKGETIERKTLWEKKSLRKENIWKGILWKEKKLRKEDIKKEYWKRKILRKETFERQRH